MSRPGGYFGGPRPISVLLLGGTRHGERVEVAPGAPQVHLYEHREEVVREPIAAIAEAARIETYELSPVGIDGQDVPVYVEHVAKLERRGGELLRAFLRGVTPHGSRPLR